MRWPPCSTRNPHDRRIADIAIIGAGIIGISCGRLSRRGRAYGHRHRPHRHLRGDEFGQCRRLRLLRRAAARPQGHDAAICRNGSPTRSGRSPSRPPICRSCCPGCSASGAPARRAATRRALPRRPALMKLAEAEWMGLMRALRHAAACCARTARWSSTKARPSSRRRCPAGRRATASASTTGTVEGDELAALSARPVAAFVRGTFVPGWKTVDDPKDLGKAIWALCGTARAPCSCRATSALAMPSQGAASPSSSGTGARSWRGRLVIAAGAWSHLLARQFGDRDPARDRARLQHDAAEGRLRREAAADLFRATASSSRRSKPACASAAPSSLAASSGRRTSRARRRCWRRRSASCRGSMPAGGREWMGYRPSLPDSLPVIGRARSTPRMSSTPSATAISA